MEIPAKRNDSTPARQILEYLLRNGVASIKDLEDALGVTATAVRQQLASLIGEGLVVVVKERQGVGRPRNLYKPTARTHNLFAGDSDEFTLALMSELVESEGNEKLRYLLGRMGDKLARQYGASIRGQAIDDRVRELSTLLDRRGVISEVENVPAGDIIILHEYNCPYHDLALVHRDVCEMERSAFSQALGTDVQLGNCIQDGSHSCQFVVSSQ